MSEQLLRTSDLCERLCMGEDAARAAMAEQGVYPIHLGVGRGRGLRWLASAVDIAIRAMHEDAQPKKKERKPLKSKDIKLEQLSIDDIYNLTHGKTVQ